jgi:hypothetical protein
MTIPAKSSQEVEDLVGTISDLALERQSSAPVAPAAAPSGATVYRSSADNGNSRTCSSIPT